VEKLLDIAPPRAKIEVLFDKYTSQKWMMKGALNSINIYTTPNNYRVLKTDMP
jgi:hypothetical protein